MNMKKKIRHTVFLLLLVSILAVAFTTCQMETSAPTSTSTSLSLRFVSDAEARTLKPDTLVLAVHSYDISGTGPDGAVFSVSGITADTYVQENLVPGSWSVIAQGKNSEGIVIVQSASTTISLYKAATNTITLNLFPIDGTGTFDLDLSWPAAWISTPAITAILTSDAGEAITLDFAITGTSAALTTLILPRGYYELTLKLTDASFEAHLVWSKVETVLIYTDALTSKNWALVAADMNSPPAQDMGLILVTDTKAPVEVILSGVSTELAYGTTMTITAAGTPAPTSWKWFLDGDVLAGQTTSAVTIGEGLLENTLHTITAIGRTGDIAGSADANFRIGSAPVFLAPIELNTAENYVILAQSAVSANAGTSIHGDIGASPVTAAAITGFSPVLDSLGTFSTSTIVDGSIYAADYAAPTPADLSQAVLDANAAYAEAAARTSLDVVDDLTSEIGGMTLVPGLYAWASAVSIGTDVTLAGSSDGIWIFQITGALTEAAAAQVVLSGGALPENIFWLVEGGVQLGANAHMEGVVLSGTAINLGAGASANGRLLAKTAVTLDSSTVTQPSN